MDAKLEYLLTHSPSIIRNSIVIRLVRTLAWILGVTLFVGGWGLIISGMISGTLMEALMPGQMTEGVQVTQEEWDGMSIVLGLAGVFLGSMFLFMTKLSGMVLKRNAFIFELYGWWADYEKVEKERKEKEEHLKGSDAVRDDSQKQ